MSQTKKEKDELLKKLEETYCRIKPSKISGVGVFATRNIPKDTDLFSDLVRPKWHKFKLTDLQGLDQETITMVDDFFVIEKDKTVWIPEFGLNGINISFFVNHSKNPNVKPVIKNDEVISFVTMRNINKGEELTTNYGDYDDKYKKQNN